MIKHKHRCNDSSPLASYLQRSSRSCFGSRRHWTLCACCNNSSTYRRPFGDMLSHPLLRARSPQPRSSFLCSSCLRKRFQLMAFLGPLHLSSKGSEEKHIKKLGGL